MTLLEIKGIIGSICFTMVGILFGHVSSGLNAGLRGLLNENNAKKTNEDRVFRIILANSKFRDLIGCNFAKTQPLECNDVTPAQWRSKKASSAAIYVLDTLFTPAY